MSQIYTTRRKEALEQDGAEHVSAPSEKIPNSARNAAIEQNMDAIAAVRPHEGRLLSLDETMVNRMQKQFGIRMDQVELRESSQPADMDAKAFAKGNVVQFAPANSGRTQSRASSSSSTSWPTWPNRPGERSTLM